MPGAAAPFPESLLFSPSEWLILRVVRLAGSPISCGAIAERLPSPGLPTATVDALLERLAAKALLQHRDGGWVAEPHDYAAMLRRQVEHFLETYVLEDPDGPDVLLRMLEERTREPRHRSDRS